MRITKCHAENFGTLRNFDYTPSEGFSVIEESNGFGKTTFSYFIKAMFYGLSPSKKTSLAENERKRFSPWQGGVFGGYIEFVSGEGSFRIERTFGAKESADSFTVYDLESGRETDKLSPVPGLVLFGVDSDTFERTCFFSERKLSPQGSTAVVGRLASLIENYNYSAAEDTTDAAITLLRNRRREIRPYKGNGGERGEVLSRLSECREEYARCREASARREALTEQIEAEEQKSEVLRARSVALNEKIKECRTALNSESKRELHLTLSAKLRECEEALALGRAFFASDTPPERNLLDRLSAVIADRRAKLTLCAERETERDRLCEEFDSNESFLAALKISPDSIDEGERLARACVEAATQLDAAEHELAHERELRAAIDRNFPNGFPSDDEINSAKRAIEEQKRAEVLLAEEIASEQKAAAMRAEREAARKANLLTREKEQAKRRILGFASVGFFISAVILFAISLIVGISSGGRIALAALSLLPIVGGAVLAVTAKGKSMPTDEVKDEESLNDLSERKSTLTSSIDEAREKIEKFKEKYASGMNDTPDEIFYFIRSSKERADRLDASISDCSTRVEKLHPEHASLVAELSKRMAEDGVSTEIAGDASKLVNEYKALRETRERALQLRRRIDSCDSELKLCRESTEALTCAASEAFSAVPGIVIDGSGDVGAQFDSAFALLSRRAWEFSAAKDEHKRALDALEKFAKENPDFSENQTALSTEELRLIEAEAERELGEIAEEREAQAKLRAALIAERTKFEEIESRSPALLGEEAALTEQLSRLERTAELYDLAEEYLSTARENIAGKYMAGLREHFEKHVLIASPERRLSVDNSLEITYESLGATRNEETMSRGERAVSELCIRLATADTLYADERPPILIDDAFAELDDRNLDRAIVLLSRAAERYQVIYFTCRDGRIPDSIQKKES